MGKCIYWFRTHSAIVLTVILLILLGLYINIIEVDLSGLEIAGLVAAITFVYGLLKSIEKEDLGYTRKKVVVIDETNGDLFERKMNIKLLQLAKEGRKIIEIRSIDKNHTEIYFIAKYDESI